jgi:hypothetical protein
MRKLREKEGENSAAVQQTLAGPLPSSYDLPFLAADQRHTQQYRGRQRHSLGHDNDDVFCLFVETIYLIG